VLPLFDVRVPMTERHISLGRVFKLDHAKCANALLERCFVSQLVAVLDKKIIVFIIHICCCCVGQNRINNLSVSKGANSCE